MHQKAGAAGVTSITVTVVNVDETTPREEHTQHRLRLLGITVNLAKSYPYTLV
jgi:hypothetical protein